MIVNMLDVVIIDHPEFGDLEGIVTDVDVENEGLTITCSNGEKYDAWFGWVKEIL